MPIEQSVFLSTPKNFDFHRTVSSHGWCSLPPFNYNHEKNELRRVLELADGTLVNCTLTGRREGVRSHVAGSGLSPGHRSEIRSHLRTCLRLDEDFVPFHREASRHSSFRWIASSGTGRLLRAPTVFEDVVKMICTTNCTWALTTIVVSNLVRLLGKKSSDGWLAFPSPAAIAATSERFLRTHVKAGYRAPYLLELAERVTSRKLDVESWRSSTLSTGDLLKEIRAVKGIGPYASENILRLLGRYDYLGLDSWVRARYYEIHHNGRKVKDGTIERRYARYGKWRGLLFWFEMTRTWDKSSLSRAESEEPRG